MRKQQAEFRLVLRDDNRYAMVTSVTVQGLDYYVVDKFKGGVLRQSLHEMGQSHTYVLGERVAPANTGKPMRAFTGIRSVWGSSLSAAPALRDWTYVPKADRPNRRLTLVVPMEVLPPLSSVDVWLVQGGREAELAAEWESRYHNIVASATMEWVEPKVAVVVKAVTKLPEGMLPAPPLSTPP
jgi:hypothetical protein